MTEDVQPSGSTKPTRLEIEAQIKAIADDCAFTMPFWFSGLLVAECRRQGLTNVQYDGDDFRVSVKIKKHKGATIGVNAT